MDGDKILLGEYLSYLKVEAQFILENFPGINSLSEVYKILAYVALNQEESQYRLAADYLGKFLNTTATQNDHLYLTKLIGDCYYLNQDYALSNDYYWSILSNNKNYLDQETLGDIWLSMIISKIKLGEIEQAFKLIDNSIDLNEFPIVYYWKMVWNLSIALEKNGLFEEAKDRLEFLFKDSKETDIPIDFILRFKWRSLYLRYMLGLDNEDSVTMSDKLLAELNDKSLDFIDRSELDLMKSQVILFKGRFLLYSNRIVRGLSILDLLKEKYPNTKAAELSYIIIANYYTSIGSLDMAESILLDLAKKYPRSKFAPKAILDAAISAEVQNPNDYKKIILLLDQIVLNYEDSPFVFFAMRPQGDLFRNSGDFVSALSIYENLIQKFPKHENIYLAELSRVDCLSALANESSLYELNDVIIDLERLLDLPNLPNEFQLEVSYKLALMFKNINNIDQSIKISLNCLDEYLNFIPGNSSYNSIGRYWIARSMLLLSDNLISVGRHEETKKIYRLMIEYNLPGKEFVEKMILEI